MVDLKSNKAQGVIFAVSAYGIWSAAPIYFKALDFVSALEVLAHRVVWSFVLTVFVMYILNIHRKLWLVLRDRRKVQALLVSTLLIAMNWGVFIWSVQNNFILSASLGYYINPLVSILLGMLFLAERLDLTRKIAAGLCVVAVVFELVNFGRLPLIAIFLATSFGLYGLVRKKLGVDSFTGMAFETGALFPIALGYLLFTDNDAARFVATTWREDFLLVLAGPITMIPLLLFAAAANRISLTALGFFQYIAPTGMFLLAVFLYNESINIDKLMTFVIIWSALGLLVIGSIRQQVLAMKKA